MKKIFLLFMLISVIACSSIINTRNKDQYLLVSNTTEHLLREKIITNKCVTLNDTIFIQFLDNRANRKDYFYFNQSLYLSDSCEICNSIIQRNRCLQFFSDSVDINKINFKFNCAGSVEGTVKIGENQKIVDVKYVKISR